MISRDSIIDSMLWAAYGDALGFMAEPCDERTLKSRTRGLGYLKWLVKWRRKIGGPYGIFMELPAGCYSDDTQLRLAVCRSVGEDGSFNFESFSKIEAPVFLSYRLGVGEGTKMAIKSLRKKSARWDANFFETPISRYMEGRGSGGATRIQPHAWTAPAHAPNAGIIREIMRNVVITHGHPVAWVGAVFHGLALRESLLRGKCPGPDGWMNILEETRSIPEICAEDSRLGAKWVPAWENASGQSLERGVSEAIRVMTGDLEKIGAIAQGRSVGSPRREESPEQNYMDAAAAIDAFNPELNGLASKTTLLSSYIAYSFSNDPEKGIIACANAFGSKTDAIGSMAGAILGALSNTRPPQKVMDADYLMEEAGRLHDISLGKPASRFAYPSLQHWSLPRSPLDAAGMFQGKLALRGLGVVKPIGPTTIQKSGDAPIHWRFFKTAFGQTLLLKHRENPSTITLKDLPRVKRSGEDHASGGEHPKKSAPPRKPGAPPVRPGRIDAGEDAQKASDVQTLDEMTDEIIKAGFDEADVGRRLLAFAEDRDGIEKAISFASIIVKAKRARLKKRGAP